MNVYVKQVGNIPIVVELENHNYGGPYILSCRLLVDGRDQFKLGYIMKTKSWYSSTCFSNYDEVKAYLPLLQEMLDIFDDGEFTDRDLKMLGYKLSMFGY